MGILKIRNRTENWKTAHDFAPLFRDAEGRRRLAERLLGKPVKSEVSLELFWFGMRDYGNQLGWKTKDYVEPCADAYKSLFGELREQVRNSDLTGRLERDIYSADHKTRLANNLIHTEIDIVLQSHHHLFIGEAKRDEKFGDRASVLKHQLVRQHVMARILLELVGSKKKIVPFVVGNDREKLAEDAQVRFMSEHFGMRKENVLRWDDVRGLAGA